MRPPTTRGFPARSTAFGSATSQAIAAELGISVRTVDNLLSRSYLKLGVSSRDELGDAMRREYVGEHS